MNNVISQPRNLTKEHPSSWIHIAEGHLVVTAMLSDFLLQLVKSQPQDKKAIAAAAICFGQMCAQACEFSLKGLLLKQGWCLRRTHNCVELFRSLTSANQSALENHFASENRKLKKPSSLVLSEFLAKSASQNIAWRYLESTANADVSATIAFVHACVNFFNLPDN